MKISRLTQGLTVLEISLVVLDLNPAVSEPVRFGSLFGTQALFHNVLVSALAFGAVTLLLDIFGAFAVADLLAKQKASKLIGKTNLLIKKAGLSRLLDVKTNLVIDFCVTLVVGTPITLILKQWQEPGRGRDENIKLGLALSVAASVVSALQGGAVVAGLWHPSATTISLAALAVISFFGVQRWLKQRLS